MQTSWQAGDRVLAWWAPDCSLWYPATVRTVEAERCHVEYDAGETAWLLLDQLRPLEIGPGSRVQCRWLGYADYYPGTVERMDGPRIHIRYDDGADEWTEMRLLRVEGGLPPSLTRRTWQVGDRLLAWWAPDSLWYPATVRIAEVERFHVEYDDAETAWLLPDQLMLLEIGEGSRVECRWQAGEAYYPGTVDRQDGPRIHLRYDDGDEEWTEMRLLRVVGGTPPSARVNPVWTNPDVEEGKPSLIRLTSEGLLTAAIPKADLNHQVAALSDGARVAGQVIPLTTLARLEGDEGGAELSIAYRTGASKTESVALTLADSTKREELMRALVERLGAGWQRHRKQKSRWSGGFWIILGLAFVAFITWVMYSEAEQIAAGRNPKLVGRTSKAKLASGIMHWIEGMIGPTGVLIIGGILMGLLVLGFVVYMSSPPVRIVIEPTRSRRGTPRVAADPR
jgi:hypothetical protein